MYKLDDCLVNKNIRLGQNARTMKAGPEFHRMLQEHMRGLNPPLNFYKLHQATGIHTGVFSEWKSGRAEPSDARLHQLAGVGDLHLTFTELVTMRTVAKYGKSVMYSPTVPTKVEGFYQVPLLGKVSAGTMQLIESPDEIQEYIAFHDITRFSGDLFALRVDGDSMEPKIPDGAVLLCRKADSITNRGIYVVETEDGEAAVKVLQYQGDEPQLKPLNPKYPPIPLGGLVIRRIFQVLEYKVDLEGRTL